MKAFTIKQFIATLPFFDNGQADFKKKIIAYPRPMRRLYRLESNLDNPLTESIEVYQYAFEVKEGYKKDKLSLLRRQLKGALSDFVKARILEESALGQNLIADFMEQRGYPEKGDMANKEALRIATDEPEQKRWLASFKAHEALHFRGEKGHLEKALQNLLLFFLVSFLKLTIEQLAIFRQDDNKSPVKEAIRQRVTQVFGLFPALKPPIIEIQKTAMAYYENLNFENFIAFKTIFWKNVDLIDSDKKNLLIYLLNAIRVYPKQNEGIKREYLPIYRAAIEKGLFAYDDELKIRTVCNILIVADFQKDYGLVMLAKTKLIPLLMDEGEREWCQLLADIYCEYGARKFGEALKTVKKLNNENCKCFDVTFRKNILKLKCLCEVSDSMAEAYDKIGNTKRSYEKLLDRNLANGNIDSLTHLRCFNFIKFLMMVNNTHQNYKKDFLLEKLATYKEEITETKWLEEKIAERPF